MPVRETFPRSIWEIENTWISLADGTRLAARIWLPEDAETCPVPAILEYLPYRKRDGTAVRDALTHPWMAGHGYACIRVDMRGNGESEGLMFDEYLKQEQDDALEVIDWLCRQPWCDGNVGMQGISWGGFNSLQVAARRPAALKAIITLCSTDDRYADDIHYKGGALLMENLGWAATMLNFSAAVPDPLLVGAAWRERWLERLDRMPMLAANWLEHPVKDAYWRHGSINEGYADIQAAVYCIGGWGDAYRNTVARMFERLPGPKKALMGPWIHKYPHFAVPNPAIGFLQEAKRWWDHWLKGIDNGIMDEPAGAFYLQDALPPKPSYAERPGAWARVAAWPPEEGEELCWSLSDTGLVRDLRSLEQPRTFGSPATTGLGQGRWCAIWYGPDGPTDQRRDDALSLCFDSPPLDEALDLLGSPRLNLTLASDGTGGQLVARLNAVAPDGQVQQITYGVRNLAVSDDLAEQRALTPGAPVTVELALDQIGYRVPAGYRLRVSLSTASFPLLWPSPRLTRLSLQPGLQTLVLPRFHGALGNSPFAEPESAPPARLEVLRQARPGRVIREDVASGEIQVEIDDDLGAVRFLDHGLEVDQRCRERYRTLPDDPLATSAEIQWHYRAGRADWQVEVDSRLALSSDAEHFLLEVEQVARCDGGEVSRRTWQRRLPRGPH